MRVYSIVNQVSHPSYKLRAFHQILRSSYNSLNNKTKNVNSTLKKNKAFYAVDFHSKTLFPYRHISGFEYDIRHKNNRNDSINSKSMMNTMNNMSVNLVLHSNDNFSKYHQQNRLFSSFYYESIENAKEILAKLKNKSKIDGNANIQDKKCRLTVQDINTCLTKLSKSKENINKKTASLAQKILKQMEGHSSTSFYLQPDRCTYNTVLNIFAKCNGGLTAAQDAEQILDGMIHRFQMSQENNTKKRKIPYPDTITFHCVMDSYAKCRSKDSAIQTQRILDRMITFRNQCEFKQSIMKDLKPNVRTYSILVNAWANSDSDDAVEQANMILDELIMKIRQQKSGITQNQKNDPTIDQSKSECNSDVVWPNSVLLNSVIKVSKLN